MNLKEFRQQHPQYADMSDEALVVGMHKKFYPDIPLADFQKKIGFNHYAENPTEGMTTSDKVVAGYGASAPNLWLGMKQDMQGGGGVAARATGIPQANERKLQAEVDEQRKLDTPLQNTGAGMTGNILGNMALSIPALYAPGANTFGGATAIGAGMNSLQPVPTGESREANAAWGGAGGFVGQSVGTLLSKALKPVTSRLFPQEQALAAAAEREGIPLTAGDRTGSRALKTTESVLENLPSTSAAQLAARDTQQRAFTAAVLRRAGINADSAEAQTLLSQKKKIGGELGDIAKSGQLDFSQGLNARLGEIVADANRHLPPEVAANVISTVEKIQAQAAHQSSLVGAMSGDTYQGWREPLRGLASNAETGRYFQQIRSSMDDAFKGQLAGAEGDAFKEASRKYANLKTIMDAMGGVGNLPAKGQVSAAQLSAALTRAMGREGMALGRGDLNELSRIGNLFVKEQIPNSGTAQRTMIQNLLTGSAPSALVGGTAGYYEGGTPGAAVGALGATALSKTASLAIPKLAQALMNSKAGQKYLTEGAVDLSPKAQRVLTDALRAGGIGTAPLLAP